MWYNWLKLKETPEMPQFEIPNQEQLLLLQTVYLRSAAPQDSVVYMINNLVDGLDTSAFEAVYKTECSRGQNPIHPKTLIKVCLYAIYQGRFTTRRMEKDTTYDLGYLYLTGARPIDHTTFSKFLTRFRNDILDLFSQIVAVCQKENLIDFKVLAIDSVKFRANASYKQQKNLRGLDKTCQNIKAKMEKLLNQVDRQEEIRFPEEKKLRRLEKRLQRVEKAKGVLNERLAKLSAGKSPTEAAKLAEKTTINITDNSAQIMQQRNGEHNPALSAVTTTDSKDDIISSFQIHTEDNAGRALQPAIEGSFKNTGRYHENYPADSAFNTFATLEYMENNGLNGLIPDKRSEVERLGLTAKGEYDRSKFKYDQAANLYRCPREQKLKLTGKLIYNDRSAGRYSNPQACDQCPVRMQCTKAKCRVLIRDDNEAVRDRMRQKLADEQNQAIYKMRAHSAEAPYGCVKHNWGFTCLLRRGEIKVAMECALLFTLHNLLKLGRHRQGKLRFST
jgi:transposase